MNIQRVLVTWRNWRGILCALILIIKTGKNRVRYCVEQCFTLSSCGDTAERVHPAEF